MKALLTAVMVAATLCAGSPVLAAPCTASAPLTAATQSTAPACADGAAKGAAPVHQVAARSVMAGETVGFISPARARSDAPAARPSAFPATTAAQVVAPAAAPPHHDASGRSLLLVGLALMIGIALRRYGAGRG